MSGTTIYQKQQFEELITSLVNSWLNMKMIEHDYNPEMLLPAINRFFNMPLRTIYRLVAKDFMVACDEAPSPWIEKDALIR